VRRKNSPVPSRPRPIATHAHTFIPVNGSVLGWVLVEEVVPLGSDELEPVLELDCVVCVSGGLPLEDEELLEEPEELEELEGLGVEDDCEVVVFPLSGSVYC
jgi:hypothetical protein